LRVYQLTEEALMDQLIKTIRLMAFFIADQTFSKKIKRTNDYFPSVTP